MRVSSLPFYSGAVTRSRRLAAALLLVAVGAASLAACTPGPTAAEEQATWDAWSATLLEDAGDAGAGGVFAADESSSVRLELGGDATYRAVELRCIGTDRASFTLEYVAGGDTITSTQEIVCHGGDPRTPIAIPTAVRELDTFTARATSPDGRGRWVALLQR